MKKYIFWLTIIIILLLFASIFIKDIRKSSKKSVNKEIIIITKNTMTVDEVKKCIIFSLKNLDSDVKVVVRESSDNVVTLKNTFVANIDTNIKEDKLIEELLKREEFKYVEPNYIYKIQAN